MLPKHVAAGDEENYEELVFVSPDVGLVYLLLD
jgi:hypothetical protein